MSDRITRFWLIRHAPTHATGLVGWSDIPADLSDRALLQRLAERLPADAPVISSDLARAVATADALAGKRPRLPHDPGLRELHFGEWELQDFATIAAREPELSRRYWDDPGEARPPGGESWNDAARRISAAIDRLSRDHAGSDIVVVAHFGTILTQLQRATGMPARAALCFRIDNLSLTRLDRLAGGWRVGGVNILLPPA